VPLPVLFVMSIWLVVNTAVVVVLVLLAELVTIILGLRELLLVLDVLLSAKSVPLWFLVTPVRLAISCQEIPAQPALLHV